MDELQGAWRVDGIGDRELLAVVPVPEGHEVTMDIEGDRVAGRSAVNRYTGAITIEGASIRFGSCAVTRMAGPPEMMATEQRFLAVLPTVESWVFDEGELRLLTGTGATALVARRP